ncbi:MAG: hypothetical protein II863_15240 [Kiritimatiellae bacterium]|nr:hypothetical protein [Kiritimatiellia bacterium]
MQSNIGSNRVENMDNTNMNATMKTLHVLPAVRLPSSGITSWLMPLAHRFFKRECIRPIMIKTALLTMALCVSDSAGAVGIDKPSCIGKHVPAVCPPLEIKRSQYEVGIEVRRSSSEIPITVNRSPHERPIEVKRSQYELSIEQRRSDKEGRSPNELQIDVKRSPNELAIDQRRSSYELPIEVRRSQHEVPIVVRRSACEGNRHNTEH